MDHKLKISKKKSLTLLPLNYVSIFKVVGTFFCDVFCIQSWKIYIKALRYYLFTHILVYFCSIIKNDVQAYCGKIVFINWHIHITLLKCFTTFLRRFDRNQRICENLNIISFVTRKEGSVTINMYTQLNEKEFTKFYPNRSPMKNKLKIKH